MIKKLLLIALLLNVNIASIFADQRAPELARCKKTMERFLVTYILLHSVVGDEQDLDRDQIAHRAESIERKIEGVKPVVDQLCTDVRAHALIQRMDLVDVVQAKKTIEQEVQQVKEFFDRTLEEKQAIKQAICKEINCDDSGLQDRGQECAQFFSSYIALLKLMLDDEELLRFGTVLKSVDLFENILLLAGQHSAEGKNK